MFRCSPRPGTAEERCLKQTTILCLLPFVFHSLHAIQEHRHESFHQSGSRCIAVAAHQSGSFAGQAQAKSAASAPSDTGTLPNRHCICHFQQVLNPAQFSSQSDVQLQTPPVQLPRISASPALLCWCSGLYGEFSVSGAPAHMTRFSGKIRSIVSRILMFSPFGSLLESVNVSREILTTPLLGHVNRCQRGNHTVL